MFVGMIAMTVILGGFAYVSTEGRLIHQFKQQYPGVGIIGMILAACFATYTLGSLLVFLLGILLPFTGKLKYYNVINLTIVTILAN